MFHRLQDERSLRMHQEAVRMLRSDPSLAIKALSILQRWDSHVSPCSKPLRDRWQAIIQSADWAAALDESEAGNQLRQASPLACLVPGAVRLEIIRATRLSSAH